MTTTTKRVSAFFRNDPFATTVWTVNAEERSGQKKKKKTERNQLHTRRYNNMWTKQKSFYISFLFHAYLISDDGDTCEKTTFEVVHYRS